MLPSVFLALEEQEKAFVVAAIRKKAKDDKDKADEIEREAENRKRGR